ncbi:MAG: hypothetical protein IPK16_32655 [Anaerolineales bacterium]|nr:hypothetical protein [Anaerolineales bacterium]
MVSDSGGISQILARLLDNALRFTVDGGLVGIDVTLDSANYYARVAVWDTGIGIAREKQEEIFRPFEQLDRGLNRQYGGAGLGLAYVLQMVKLLGGSIVVESTVGQGSRFIVTLPMAPAK